MNQEFGTDRMWARSLKRPEQVIVGVLLGGCLVSILGLGLVTWHGRVRLLRIRTRVQHTTRILQVGLRAERLLLERPEEVDGVNPALIAELRHELSDLRAAGRSVDPESDELIARLDQALAMPGPVTRQRLVELVAVVNRVLQGEIDAQGEVWRRVDRDTSREQQLIVGFCVAVVLAAAVTYWNTLRWILAPLRDLRGLLAKMASGDRRTVEVDRVHPILVPLFSSYNQLVVRLEELEADHRSRARVLEGEIRIATRALLEQHGSLARAERLAAVGETTASLAHELRNPLAGILMSLGNLRRDVGEPDLVERLDLVVAEIERLNRLLNQALSTARHRPEAPRRLNLRELVLELVALLRNQVPVRVRLECTVADTIEAELPRDRVRQALLNLIINSVRAIGEDAGCVVVEATLNQGLLDLEVRDDGPGFPEGMLHAPVRAFMSRGAGGTGLGLAMVRRVAVDLGGEIHLSNLEPRGACVRLVVPCADG